MFTTAILYNVLEALGSADPQFKERPKDEFWSLPRRSNKVKVFAAWNSFLQNAVDRYECSSFYVLRDKVLAMHPPSADEIGSDADAHRALLELWQSRFRKAVAQPVEKKKHTQTKLDKQAKEILAGSDAESVDSDADVTSTDGPELKRSKPSSSAVSHASDPVARWVESRMRSEEAAAAAATGATAANAARCTATPDCGCRYSRAELRAEGVPLDGECPMCKHGRGYHH